MTTGEKIKEICRIEGINLKQFSELCEISYSTIKGYARDLNTPSIIKINKMTEHPRLAPYRNLLLSIDEKAETIGEDPEMMELIRQCEELGIADEAADVIRALLKHAKPK